MSSTTLKVLETINEFQKWVDSKQNVPFSSSIMVKRSEFVEFIESIKVNLPGEFEKCQRILSEVETLTQQAEATAKAVIEDSQNKAQQMLDDARDKSDKMIEKAKSVSEQMVSESEILRRSKELSRQIEEETSQRARAMIENAHDTSTRTVKQALSELDHSRNMLTQLLHKLEGPSKPPRR